MVHVVIEVTWADVLFYLGASVSGACRGVMAWNMEDGTLHRFRATNTILATGVRLPSFFVFKERLAGRHS